MFDFITAQLENQFFSGGLVLLIFGSIVAMGRQ